MMPYNIFDGELIAVRFLSYRSVSLTWEDVATIFAEDEDEEDEEEDDDDDDST